MDKRNEELVELISIMINELALLSGPDKWRDGIVIPLPVKIPEEFFDFISDICKISDMDRIEFLESYIFDLIIKGLRFMSTERLADELKEMPINDIINIFKEKLNEA